MRKWRVTIGRFVDSAKNRAQTLEILLISRERKGERRKDEEKTLLFSNFLRLFPFSLERFLYSVGRWRPSVCSFFRPLVQPYLIHPSVHRPFLHPYFENLPLFGMKERQMYTPLYTPLLGKKLKTLYYSLTLG